MQDRKHSCPAMVELLIEVVTFGTFTFLDPILQSWEVVHYLKKLLGEKSQDGRPPWRIVPVLVSPLSRVVPLPNGLNTFIN